MADGALAVYGGPYEIRRWLTAEQARGVRYSSYWNDEEEERGKEWWTLDGDFSRMETYLDETTTLGEQLTDSLAKVQPRGVGADLAAGTLWAVPRLLTAGAEKVYAVEFSEHRLLRIGPSVLEHYGVAPHRAVLCLGSFYTLGIDDAELDFVLLSQALHHADDPGRLLDEAARVLRPGGVVHVIGEPLPSPWSLLRRAATRLGIRSHLVDPLLGDHVYTLREYARMFRRAGLRLAETRCYPDGVAFVLSRGR